MSEKRRKHRRVPFHVSVDLRSGGRFYAGATRDLSEGGLFIESSADVSLGGKVDVRLPLFGRRYQTSAEVAWILDDASGHPIGFGARFLDLPRGARIAILSFVQRRAPEPPVAQSEWPQEIPDLEVPPPPESGELPALGRRVRPGPPSLSERQSCAPPAAA